MSLRDCDSLKLEISGELQAKLERDLIFPEDIQRVIYHAEKTATRLFDTRKKCFIAHRQNGFVTFWVEYRPKIDSYEVLNAYSHRIKILEGG